MRVSTLGAKLLRSGGGRRQERRHNNALSETAKVEIRHRVLTEITPQEARVFDAFAGSGVLYRRVWHEAAAYAGCDVVWYRDERRLFVADNLRVLRAIDLSRFNIFDFDSYGSPWEQVLIVAARRRLARGERIGIVLTEGSGIGLKMGKISAPMRAMTGIRGSPAGGSRSQEELLERGINGLHRRMRARVVRRWQARGKTAAGVFYVGLVLEGLDVPVLPK